MKIRIYNTLSHQVETFQPIEPGVVRMYNCGLTVYDYGHIGNFRSFLFADVLRRFLELAGFRVQQVMNITDVGHMTEDQFADGGGQDKMALAAQRLKKQGVADVENPEDPFQAAAYFTRVFLEDAGLLRLKIAQEFPARMPKATDHVPQMIQLIERLIAAKHAYVGRDGAVYYDVKSFADYGRLSGNTLDKLQAGAGGRVSDSTQAVKRNPNDFLLWKPDPKHLMKWPSPWGEGYPGWHIECSAMAMHTHGTETLDIHTGGEDNVFPHHECEIAQSTGATGKPFAHYWMHARHLLVEGEKMSKSKGNFFTVRDLLKKNVDPAVLRYELIRTHYRSNANFTMKGLEDSDRAVRRLRAMAGERPVGGESEAPVVREFAEALANDLNMSEALGVMFKWLGSIGEPSDADRQALWKMDEVLGVVEPTESGARAGDDEEGEIEASCRALDDARSRRDFAASDRIRDELLARGIEVQITREGTKWRRKIQVDV